MNSAITTTPAARLRLLRLPALCEKVGLAKSTVYRLIGEQAFPPGRPHPLDARATVWLEEEVDLYLRERLASSGR